MKTSININLFGTLYAIDEDAHLLLDQYLNNMKSYFSHQQGGEEIADDIEHRIAELFWELRQQGNESITIEQVTDIIHQVGNPEEMTSSAENADAQDDQQATDGQTTETKAPQGEHAPLHRLYRDSKDKVLGGVLGGICRYFGWSDAIVLRLAYVLLTVFTSGIFVLIYLLFWFIVPKAVTAEDRLHMQGKAVNPDTIRAEVLDSQQMPAQADNHSGCLKMLLGAVLAPVGCLVLLMCFVVIVTLFALLMGGLGAVASLTPKLAGIQLHLSTVITLIISGIAVIALPIYALYRWFRRDHRPVDSLTWVILAVLLAIAAITGYTSCRSVQNSLRAIDWNNLNLDLDIAEGDADEASAGYITRRDTLDSFESIEFDGIGQLRYHLCDSTVVHLLGSEQLVNRTLANVSNGVLCIGHDEQGARISGKQRLTLDIYGPALASVTLKGVGSLKLDEGHEQQQPLALAMKGVGKISAEHLVCPKLTIDNEGVGKVEVGNLSTDSLAVSLRGVGKVEVSGTTHSYVRNKDGVGKIEDEELKIE